MGVINLTNTANCTTLVYMSITPHELGSKDLSFNWFLCLYIYNLYVYNTV